MKNLTIKITLAAAVLLSAQTLLADEYGHSIKYAAGKLQLDFRSAASLGVAPYSIRRSEGRLGDYKEIAKSPKGLFEEHVEGNPNRYYYKIYDAKNRVLDTLALELELFGRDVHIYRPTDDIDSIASDMARIHKRMSDEEFGRERYAALFAPGDYCAAGTLNVPFYLHLAGLGKTPFEVRVDNIITAPMVGGNDKTCNFWRSVENLSVAGAPEDGQALVWESSQAMPMRRVYSERVASRQCGNSRLSGGYAADCWFNATVDSNSRQQSYTRNCHFEDGYGNVDETNSNHCFQGVTFGAEVPAESCRDNWDAGGCTTFIASTPKIREKPFLFMDDEGHYKIFRPALRHNAVGVSYSRTEMGNGEVIDLIDECFLVKPGTNAAEINVMAGQGKHIVFLPGIHEVEEPIHITKPNTVVMGIGWATIIPGAANGETAIKVDDVDGVTVASLLFDAHYNSRTLISVGSGTRNDANHSANPILLADLFFRIGGFLPASVDVDCAVEITANDVICDHLWMWRADHGVRYGVGWSVNTSRSGLVVKGDYVSAYGLFTEHFQGYQVYWEGNCGRNFFFQCETPYDASSLRYKSENGKRDGYAAYKWPTALPVMRSWRWVFATTSATRWRLTTRWRCLTARMSGSITSPTARSRTAASADSAT